MRLQRGTKMTYCIGGSRFPGGWLVYPCCSHLEHRASVKRFVSLQFINVRHSVGLFRRVINPSSGRYLKRTQNKHRHPCLNWDWNLRSQRSNERTQFMPYSARPLRSAVPGWCRGLFLCRDVRVLEPTLPSTWRMLGYLSRRLSGRSFKLVVHLHLMRQCGCDALGKLSPYDKSCFFFLFFNSGISLQAVINVVRKGKNCRLYFVFPCCFDVWILRSLVTPLVLNRCTLYFRHITSIVV
jgi:hypothetical protein